MKKRLVFGICCLLLVACGQKGDLYTAQLKQLKNPQNTDKTDFMPLPNSGKPT